MEDLTYLFFVWSFEAQAIRVLPFGVTQQQLDEWSFSALLPYDCIVMAKYLKYPGGGFNRANFNYNEWEAFLGFQSNNTPPPFLEMHNLPNEAYRKKGDVIN